MAFPFITKISTSRLTIRPVEHGDLADLIAINGDDEVTRFLPYATWKSIDDGIAWLKRMNAITEAGTGQQLVVVNNTTQRVIGTILLFRFDEGSARVEIGYVIGRSYWQHGFAKEALAAVCNHVFRNLSIRRVEAEVDPNNLASNAVMQSLGFVKEGLLRKRWITKGVATDTHIYGCLADEWQMEHT
jgi:RimJ/RimL family protein N-acetyltransferase